MSLSSLDLIIAFITVTRIENYGDRFAKLISATRYGRGQRRQAHLETAS